MTTYDDDMPIYISIYDKKPRKIRALTCTLTDEEKKKEHAILLKNIIIIIMKQFVLDKPYTAKTLNQKKQKKYKLFLNKLFLKNIFF